MPVIVGRIPVAAFAALPACGWPVGQVAAADLTSEATARLLAAAAHAPGGFPAWSAAGLAADARGRQGRTVRAWAAVGPDGAWAAVIGLAEATVGATRRFSIPWLVVDPRHRRRGVGAGMVREVLAAAAASGAGYVTVETLTSWDAARAFWEAIASRTWPAG